MYYTAAGGGAPLDLQAHRLRLPPAASSVLAADLAAGDGARERCQALLAALGRRGYARGWLPRAADAELSAELARACTQLWVTPVSSDAAARIGLRCAHLANVAVDVSAAARRAQSAFDLIVVSGFDAFSRPAELVAAALELVPALAPHGELIAIHALRPRADRALHGDAVHHLLLEHLPLEWHAGEREPEYRIDRWGRA